MTRGFLACGKSGTAETILTLKHSLTEDTGFYCSLYLDYRSSAVRSPIYSRLLLRPFISST
jgi:hypothetical protein